MEVPGLIPMRAAYFLDGKLSDGKNLRKKSFVLACSLLLSIVLAELAIDSNQMSRRTKGFSLTTSISFCDITYGAMISKIFLRRPMATWFFPDGTSYPNKDIDTCREVI